MSLQEFYILSGHHCGCDSEVIDAAVHGLSCLKSEGHHHRHASVNDIIHRAMSAAWIPSRLEPSGLSVLIGKDMTGLPWYSGSVVSSLPGTCSDTYAPSYSAIAATYAGGVANQAEVKNMYTWTTTIIATGCFGSEALKYLKELGHQIKQRSGECKAYSYLLQAYQIH